MGHACHNLICSLEEPGSVTFPAQKMCVRLTNPLAGIVNQRALLDALGRTLARIARERG